MASLKATLALAGGLAAAASSVSAQDISSFGDGVPGALRGSDAVCPDVVVLNVPFCTDETGQAACINGDRRSIAAQALETADVDGNNLVYAFVQAGASHLATDAHNVGLTQARASFTLGLLQSYNQVSVRVAGYQALFGESFASGGANADFNFDRYGQAYLTDNPAMIGQTRDGRFAPVRGAVVVDYRTPPCNSHRRDVSP